MPEGYSGYYRMDYQGLNCMLIYIYSLYMPWTIHLWEIILNIPKGRSRSIPKVASNRPIVLLEDLAVHNCAKLLTGLLHLDLPHCRSNPSNEDLGFLLRALWGTLPWSKATDLTASENQQFLRRGCPSS